MQGETYRINSVFGTKVFTYIGQDEIVVGSGSFGSPSTEKQPALFWYNLQGTASFGYYKTLNPYELTPISVNISLGPVEFEHWVPDA